MPVMPRTNKKSSKIAFNILGIPSNMVKDRSKKKRPKSNSGPNVDNYYPESFEISPRKF